MKSASCILAFSFALALIFFLPQEGQAHRLNIYAWLEGNQIVVESNFGKDHPARNAQIRIVDSDTGQVLMEGRTSANGIYTFPVPKVVQDGHGLKVEVNAGQGHFNDWKMTASELYAAASLTAGFDQERIDNMRENNSQSAPRADSSAQNVPASPRGAYQIPPSGSLSAQTQAGSEPANIPAPSAQNIPMPNGPAHEQMRGIIEEAMANQLRSVHQAIARQNSSGPTLVNVIGGLGWIVGLVGIYLYSRARRELDRKNREAAEK